MESFQEQLGPFGYLGGIFCLSFNFSFFLIPEKSIFL